MALTTNQLVVGMFNMAAGGYKTLVGDYVTAHGNVAAADALLPASGLNPQFMGTNLYSNTDFASALVGKVLSGVSTTIQSSIATIVSNYMTANPTLSRGAVVVAVLEAVLAVPTTDATLGAAVSAYTAKVALADASTSTSTDFTELAAVVGQQPTTTGETFTLTTAADNITGTSGNDTIRGGLTYNNDPTDAATVASGATYSASDAIAGGSGTDTLELTVDGTGYSDGSTLPAASLTGLETLSVRALTTGGGVILDGSGSSATTYVNERSTAAVTFNNIGTADVTINGNNSVTLGATTVDVGSTAVTDAFVLNLAGGLKGTANIDVSDTDAQWTSATINSTGAANSAGTVTVGGAKVKDLAINASSAFSATAIAGFDATTGVTNTITIAGAAAATSTNTGVSIGTLADAVDVVNASGLTTGGLTMTLSSSDGMAALKVTGGAGQDKITTNAVALATGAAIDAGGGSNDVLIVGASAHITSTLGAFYKNFEVAQVGNGVTLDMNHLTDANTISSINLILTTDGTDGAAISNVTATQAGAITVGLTDTDGTDAQTTIALKNATDVGQLDTVKLIFDDGDSTATTTSIFAHTDGGLVLAGVETLTLDASADKSQVVLGTDAAALTTVNLSGAKDQNVSFTAAYTFNTNTSISGSDATGALTINTSAASDSTAAVAITGGTKGDTITFWADDATDVSDAAATTVAGKGGLDTITAVAGQLASDASTVTTSFKILSDVVSSADADLLKIMDSTGTDAWTDGATSDSTWAFKYTGALSNGTGTTSDGIAAAEIVSATTFAGALADGSAANAIVFKATVALSTSGTSLSTLQGAFTQTNVDAFIAGLVATGGSLTGGITGLDSTLGATDAVLLILDDDTHSAILRITNTDTATANTLTTSEIALVGVISNVNDFGASTTTAANGVLVY